MLWSIFIPLPQLLYKLSSMPFLFRTEVKESPLDGLGVFALENIPKGATYWVWDGSNQPIVPVVGIENQTNIFYRR